MLGDAGSTACDSRQRPMGPSPDGTARDSLDMAWASLQNVIDNKNRNDLVLQYWSENISLSSILVSKEHVAHSFLDVLWSEAGGGAVADDGTRVKARRPLARSRTVPATPSLDECRQQGHI